MPCDVTNMCPTVNFQNVIDQDTKRNLYQYLADFNHLNLGYCDTKETARQSVRPEHRKKGLYITYYIDNSPITEYFDGSKTQAGDKETWINDELWIPVDYESINATIPIADEEDITEVEGETHPILKFADKAYSPARLSGKGRKMLRRKEATVNVGTYKANIAVLTQEDFDAENTIYIVQYDFNLNGATIKLPEDVILFLYGGTLTNGTIYGNCTEIIGTGSINCTLKGTWRNFGISTNRPDVALVGATYFDTTLNKPLWWDGFNWVDATGKSV